MTEGNSKNLLCDIEETKKVVYVDNDIVNTGIGVVIDVQNVFKYFGKLKVLNRHIVFYKEGRKSRYNRTVGQRQEYVAKMYELA